jgi:hypothetical protein
MASILVPAILPSPLSQSKDIKLEKQLSPPPMGPIACVAPGASSEGSDSHDGSHLASAPSTATAKRPAPSKRWDQQTGDETVTLFPRRKAGQNRPGGGRGPLVLTLELLEQFYGMPLHVAAKQLVSFVYPPTKSSGVWCVTDGLIAITLDHPFFPCYASLQGGVTSHHFTGPPFPKIPCIFFCAVKQMQSSIAQHSPLDGFLAAVL